MHYFNWFLDNSSIHLPLLFWTNLILQWSVILLPYYQIQFANISSSISASLFINGIICSFYFCPVLNIRAVPSCFIKLFTCSYKITMKAFHIFGFLTFWNNKYHLLVWSWLIDLKPDLHRSQIHAYHCRSYQSGKAGFRTLGLQAKRPDL